MRYQTILILLLTIATTSFSQGEPDFQLRIPTHIQLLGGDSNTTNRFGFAGWIVLPNILASGNGQTKLLAGGLLWQHGEKDWVEFMGGTRLAHGYAEPLINLRFSDSHTHVVISGDLQQYFGQQGRFIWLIAAETQTHLKQNLKVGVESENINYFGERRDSWGIGPRVVFPVSRLPSWIKPSITVAYQFRNDRNFVRIYLTTLLRFH